MINIKKICKKELEKYDGVAMPVKAKLVEQLFGKICLLSSSIPIQMMNSVWNQSAR